MGAPMSRVTLICLIWEALKECGWSRVPTPMEVAMPFIREHGQIEEARFWEDYLWR